MGWRVRGRWNEVHEQLLLLLLLVEVRSGAGEQSCGSWEEAGLDAERTLMVLLVLFGIGSGFMSGALL